MVVLFHLQTPWFSNGFLGVDIFFVISGYLMAKLYNKNTVLGFYRRRLDRLFSAYIVTILATVAAGFFMLIPVDLTQLLDQSASASLFVSNLFYWNQNSYFDKAAFNPLLNLWSLAVEVQFYLLVPFLYRGIRNKPWIFALIFFLSITSCFIVQAISPKTAFFMMPLRVWEFLIGACVAWYPERKPSWLERHKTFFQILLLGLLCAFPFLVDLKPDATGTLRYGHPALPALAITLLTGAVIRIGIPSKITMKGIGWALSKTGDASYSIYLIHFPVIVLCNYAPFGGTRLTSADWQGTAKEIVLICLLSIFSYIFIEKRLAQAIDSIYFRWGTIALVLLLSNTLNEISLARYSDAERNIFSAWTDRDTYRCGKMFRIIHPGEIICNISSVSSGENVLLIGNSHADSIKKVFSDRAAEAGFTTYFVVSNEPLLGGKPTAEQIVSASLEHKISTYVIHYSNVYASEKARKGISELISLADKNNIKVFLIGPVPTYSEDVPKAMLSDKDGESKISATLDGYRERNQAYAAFIKTLDGFNVMTFDPSVYLCPRNGHCLFSSSTSKPYYFDSSHLTLTGSMQLNPLFVELFSRAQ